MGKILWACLILVIMENYKCEEVTLTTAVTRPNTSPMPSTDFRRREFLSRVHKSRKSTSHEPASNWDFYCKLQPVKGNCSQHHRRYHYKSQLNKCVLFTYTGCRGNKNNFKSLLECERYCKGANFMDDEESMLKLPHFCYLQPDSGNCLGVFQKFYYDVNAGRCKPFVYGGCSGNSNRFDTFTQCTVQCSYLNQHKLLKYVE